MKKKIIVSGGAGFIGSAVVRELMLRNKDDIVILDALTYAGNLESIPGYETNKSVSFAHVDIRNWEAVLDLFRREQPNLVMHLAAESHVDRSISGSRIFVETNIVGTYNLLEASRALFEGYDSDRQRSFRFHHISTDEVFGDLAYSDELFTEDSAYAPSSPYSASKASSDHLVRAWGRTYGLPVILTNCSNNYGPYHYPEKLIPQMILNALNGKCLPVYGDGNQIRDWLHVEDHARALITVANEALPGSTYNIGGHNEIRNIEVVEMICDLLEELNPQKPPEVDNYSDLITFVKDRPGHDLRYAIDASKIKRDLNWTPTETFETGLRKTVIWYLNNVHWWKKILQRAR